jgi:predicted NUDIX family phosphoesterase
MSKEKIMVVPSIHFDKYNTGNHFITGAEAVRLYRTIMKTHSFRERATVEEDEGYRQPIPYIIVENALGEFLQATRSKAQGESRLWGKHTIGVGGHVDEADSMYLGNYLCFPIQIAAHREYKEETGWNDFGVFHLVGILVTNDTAVDRVHVGMVYHYITDQYELISPEKDHHAHKWVVRRELAEVHTNMELWSQLLIIRYLSAPKSQEVYQ